MDTLQCKKDLNVNRLLHNTRLIIIPNYGGTGCAVMFTTTFMRNIIAKRGVVRNAAKKSSTAKGKFALSYFLHWTVDIYKVITKSTKLCIQTLKQWSQNKARGRAKRGRSYRLFAANFDWDWSKNNCTSTVIYREKKKKKKFVVVRKKVVIAPKSSSKRAKWRKKNPGYQVSKAFLFFFQIIQITNFFCLNDKKIYEIDK